MNEYLLNPDVCPSSLGEDDTPVDMNETAHKWDEDSDPITCAECGAEKEMEVARDIPLSDVQDLAHLVKTSYLPVFKRDIENSKDGLTKPLLQQRYNEVEKLCNKYLKQ